MKNESFCYLIGIIKRNPRIQSTFRKNNAFFVSMRTANSKQRTANGKRRTANGERLK
jgi:hypothetical protein